MIDTISMNTKPALLAMSSMMGVLNAHLKITALNVSQIFSTFKITFVEVALSLMASVCNAQLQNIALNVYPTNTTSMKLPSIVLPANQPWKDAPPAKINRNAQTALLLTSLIRNKLARNAYQYSITASLAQMQMFASLVKAITTLMQPINAKIAIILLPIVSPVRAIILAVNVRNSMYLQKKNNVSFVKM